MPEELISGLFDIQRRYIRSANLQRDFADPSSMDGYVVTAEVKDILVRLQTGLQRDSTQRAWRITGDYGSGKSSFALLIAHVMGGRGEQLPNRLKQAVRSSKAQAQLLPVLVMGNREPIANTLLSALLKAVQGARTTGPAPSVLTRIEKLLKDQAKRALSVSELIEAVEAVSEYATRNGRFDGMLIIVDELGKTLEYSALHPEQEDVFILQALAEAAARSGRKPLFVLGLLHQGFNAYAESLSQAAQREWEKVGMSLQYLGAKEHRARIRSRATELLITMTEPRLRAFCLQLADQGLGDTEWIKGLASLICSKPPSKWMDRDIELFDRELTQLTRGFVRLESLLFAERKSGEGENAIRVAITHRDGTELECVVFLSHSQASKVQALESKIVALLEGGEAEVEVALANAFWKIFGSKVVQA